jgi:hypothetical protein
MEDLFDRFIKKVNKTDSCWLWTAAIRGKSGYGAIRVNRKTVDSHRLSYKLHNGEIPENMYVCHTCDNPLCCNPKHLWLGTMKQNMQDMHSKGRAKVFGGVGGGMKGKVMPRTTCVHCNRSISNPAYSRSHGDKCKSKGKTL